MRGDRGRRLVFGVDFSAAADAGRRIWIATGVALPDRLRIDRLRIADCRSVAEIAGTSTLLPSLRALRRFISDRPRAVFGLDFPFGLPLAGEGACRWVDLVEATRDTCATPDGLRERVRDARRITDQEAAAPFAPGNLRLYKQTFHGIVDVLVPLIRSGHATVLPMQYRRSGAAWIIEICPAVTLRRDRLARPYKGRGEERASARRAILAALAGRGVVLSQPVLERAARDPGGDALDAIVAAYATYRALASEFRTCGCSEHLIEGHIYS